MPGAVFTDCGVWSVWSVLAWEHCEINRPCLLAECRKKRLDQGSFVLLYFALFAFLCCV